MKLSEELEQQVKEAILEMLKEKLGKTVDFNESEIGLCATVKLEFFLDMDE